MKEIVTQCKAGLYMATQSFSMLWYQKKFLIYLGSLALLNIAFKLIITNAHQGIPFFSIFGYVQNYIDAMPSWLQPVSALIALFIGNSLTIFFTVSLLHHIADTMENRESSVRANFSNSFSKMHAILGWAAISSTLEEIASFSIDKASSIDHSMHAFASTVIIFVLWAAISCWLLATFFVLPLLAVKNESLFAMVRSSISISRQSIALIVGGECWFVLIIVLVATPFLLIWLLAQQPIINPTFFVLGLLCAEIIVKCWVATAHSVFKMILYRTHQEKTEHPTPEGIVS